MSVLMHRLKALAVLEAVLRTGSFSRAAESLFITQSAVSQHIKQLEGELGLLFERLPRQLKPTPRAERLRPFLQQGFAQLEEGWRQIQNRDEESVVTITLLPSFASRWLLPRLAQFTACCPEIELRLAMSDQLQDLQISAIDLAIRFGRGNYPGLQVTHLMDDELFPVASPGLLAREGAPATPAELARFTLLKDNSLESFNWSSWLRLAGVTEFVPSHNLTISDSAQVVNMALAGQGVALARRSLVGTELQNGTLVQLFDLLLPCPFAYYLLQTPRTMLRPAVQRFVLWLQQQIAQDKVVQAELTRSV